MLNRSKTRHAKNKKMIGAKARKEGYVVEVMYIKPSSGMHFLPTKVQLRFE